MHSTMEFASFTMSATFAEELVFSVEAVPEDMGLMTSLSYDGNIPPRQLVAMVGHAFACLLEALDSERKLPLSVYPLMVMLRDELDQTARDFRQELERYEDTDKPDEFGGYADFNPFEDRPSDER